MPRLALHQPVLHNAEHGLADHLRVAPPWRAPTEEREFVPLLIRARQLQQRSVHLAMALPLQPQPDPIPRDGVGAAVDLQRVGIAEDGGSPHIDPVAVMALVDDGDHGVAFRVRAARRSWVLPWGLLPGYQKRSSSKGFV